MGENIIEMLKVILFGIVEGITEWLPISSTGHMILLDEFLTLNIFSEREGFKELFLVVIQLGAILAVVVMYFSKLWPFSSKEKNYLKKDTWILWSKILVACIPAGIIGTLFNDEIDALFMNAVTVTVTLILYGVIFIVMENAGLGGRARVKTLNEITYKMAFFIGIFQLLSLIPGTSRSGATIIGALLIGASRFVAAEFTFFLAIPVMAGASLIKILKFGFDFTMPEIVTLTLGMGVAFFVSILAIRFLVGYIKKHDFKVFGWYRIILGVLLGGYFLLG